MGARFVVTDAKESMLRATRRSTTALVVPTNPSTGKYQCFTCRKEYSLKQHMLYHHRYECSTPRYFKCYYCNMLIIRQGNLRKHIKRMHPNKPYKFDVIQTDIHQCK